MSDQNIIDPAAVEALNARMAELEKAREQFDTHQDEYLSTTEAMLDVSKEMFALLAPSAPTYSIECQWCEYVTPTGKDVDPLLVNLEAHMEHAHIWTPCWTCGEKSFGETAQGSIQRLMKHRVAHTDPDPLEYATGILWHADEAVFEATAERPFLGWLPFDGTVVAPMTEAGHQLAMKLLPFVEQEA